MRAPVSAGRYRSPRPVVMARSEGRPPHVQYINGSVRLASAWTTCPKNNATTVRAMTSKASGSFGTWRLVQVSGKANKSPPNSRTPGTRAPKTSVELKSLGHRIISLKPRVLFVAEPTTKLYLADRHFWHVAAFMLIGKKTTCQKGKNPISRKMGAIHRMVAREFANRVTVGMPLWQLCSDL